MTDTTATEPDPAGKEAYTALTQAFGSDLEAVAAARSKRRRLLPSGPAKAGSRGRRSWVRRPRMALGGLTAAVALGATLAIAGIIQGGPTLLTPQEAVAAVARDLSTDGVLHWETGTPGTAGVGQSDYDTWIDLKSGARHMRLLGNPVNELGGRTPSQSWFDGRRSRWAIWGPYRRGSTRQLVSHQVRRSGEAIPDFENPVQQLRRQLALGVAGKAKIEDAGVIDGRPVAKVTQTARFGEKGRNDPDPKYTQTTITWITREPTPRLVRTTTSWNGPRAGSFTEQYVVWELRARSREVLAHVRHPRFDPRKYVVRTQYLGPRKR